jgi:hypothetical protein
MKKNDLGKLVSELSNVNIRLWHEEDKARLSDVNVVFQAKRNIDKLNQQRNDLIEKIDELVQEELKNGGNRRKSGR